MYYKNSHFMAECSPAFSYYDYIGLKKRVVKQLQELYYAGKTVAIITTDATCTDMAIESVQISKSRGTGHDRGIPISFKKIRTTSAKTASIPDSYGKTGKTGVSVGTANTSAGSGESGGSGSSNGSSEKNNGNKKSSILYGAASAMGLL